MGNTHHNLARLRRRSTRPLHPACLTRSRASEDDLGIKEDRVGPVTDDSGRDTSARLRREFLICGNIPQRTTGMKGLLQGLLLVLMVTAMAQAPAYGQEAIGRATAVKPQARGTVAGTLAPNSNVHSNETISTEAVGQADLKFHDESNLAVGPKSSVRLDKFVFDPNKGKGQIVIDAAKGAFRFSTGSQGKSTVKTPYGTLGIRG
jgi:FecR protein